MRDSINNAILTSNFVSHLNACPNGPKGEQRIAQAFRPGNHTHKELALKGRPSESPSMNVAFGNHAWQSDAPVRQSFRNADAEKRPRGGLEVLSGRIYRRCFPRAEALGCSVSPFHGYCDPQSIPQCPNSKDCIRSQS
jgi:hypothetical protein